MAAPNVGEIIATTIANRSRKIADNVTKNSALLTRLSERDNIQTVDGGSSIVQELSFAENGTFQWYSGYDKLDISPSEVLDYAEYAWKQAAVAVSISGLDELRNSGRERMIDLITQRVKNAEATMKNNVSTGLYSDGTGTGGKQITGLGAAVPTTPTTGTYGGINRATWSFWQPVVSALGGTTPTAALVQGQMNAVYLQLINGSDAPDLIVQESIGFAIYLASLQAIQRITDPKLASLGFQSVKFMGGNADVVLDGGMGGACTTKTMFFLNTNHIFLRPHKDRNMVSMSGDRVAIDQDARVKFLFWAGNLAMDASRNHGRMYWS
jgi:hypothetical protein